MGKAESFTLANSAIDDNKRDRGIFVKPAGICLYLLISILLALTVGLIVHFANPNRKRVCGNSESVDELKLANKEITWEICLNMSKHMDKCLHDITCAPNNTTPAPTLIPEVPITIYRLPKTLRPYHYNVDIRADIYQDDPEMFGFIGHVDIFLNCIVETDDIVVNFKLLSIDTISIEDINTLQSISVVNVSSDIAREVLHIHLKENITEGQLIKVAINYQGNILSDMKGVYWTSYPENGTTKYIMSSQFEPTSARKAFPCLDEPQLKATFNVSLWRKEPMKALSNMPIYHTEYMEEGWYKDYFMQTPIVLPTYLMVFVIADYDYIFSTTSGGQNLKNKKNMRIFSRPNFIANGYADYALEVSSSIFDYLEEYFNYPYPLPKTDQVTVPNFSSAMEHWGLITYKESRLLVDPSYSSQYDVWRFTRTISHEFVHQWLGNTVTVAWWDDIWLQEGAARYIEELAVQHAQPEWNQTITYIAMTYYQALDEDYTGDTHPLNNPAIKTISDINSMFSIITYGKGSTVFRLVHQYIFRDHPEAFEQAMRNYVQNNALSNVQHDDLLKEFDKAAALVGIEVNVTEVVYTWIKQMGYPVVTFHRAKDGQTVHVTQKVFLINEAKPLREKYPSPYSYTWEVPLSYYTSIDPSPKFDWLHKENKTITLKTPLGENDWLIGNYHQLGFYRVNYDEMTWNAILKQLKINHQVINVIQRGQILDDAFDMGRAMVTDQLYALRAAEYLQNETEYLPWYAAMHGIKHMDMMLSISLQYGLFREYVAQLLVPNYERYKWNKQERILDGFLQVLTISKACEFGIQDCLQNSIELFKQWMDQPDNLTIIRPDYRSTVYCHSIRNDASEASWKFLFEQYQLVDHEIERKTMRNALGCTLQSWLLYRYFDMGAQKDDRIPHADHVLVMRAVAKNYPSGNTVAFDYLSQNWHDMSASKLKVLSDITDSYTTEYDRSKFEHFVSHHPPNDSAEAQAYEDMRFTINANIKWRKLNEQKIMDWLLSARKRQLNNKEMGFK